MVIQGFFFQPFLPKTCFKPVNFSTPYVTQDICNVLGLHASTTLTGSEVHENQNICLVDIISKDDNCESNWNSLQNTQENCHLSEEQSDIDKSEGDLNGALNFAATLSNCSFKVNDKCIFVPSRNRTTHLALSRMDIRFPEMGIRR